MPASTSLGGHRVVSTACGPLAAGSSPGAPCGGRAVAGTPGQVPEQRSLLISFRITAAEARSRPRKDTWKRDRSPGNRLPVVRGGDSRLDEGIAEVPLPDRPATAGYVSFLVCPTGMTCSVHDDARCGVPAR